MSRSYPIERAVSELSDNLPAISNSRREAVQLDEINPHRAPSISKIIFKTGSPDDIPSDGLFDFICLAGVSSCKMELMDLFQRANRVMRPGGELYVIDGTNIDSIIYYGMENGFLYLKSETTEICPSNLLDHRRAGAVSLFFTLMDVSQRTGVVSKKFLNDNNKVTGVRFSKG